MASTIQRRRNHIQAMRRNRGLLQKQLAKLLGHASARQVSQYEMGASLPPFLTALLLEVALGIRLADLYPDLYRDLQVLVLRRAESLPFHARRAIVGRLLNEDIPDDHP
jgi:transcriptional regulator with XRE-family HTH domain